jgi:hypothetical protein
MSSAGDDRAAAAKAGSSADRDRAGARMDDRRQQLMRGRIAAPAGRPRLGNSGPAGQPARATAKAAAVGRRPHTLEAHR